jgi:arginyl-tRNA--protein-N-Asp/Glu arginylyltransferase
VTQHFPTRQLRFFLTAPTPCPYLPGREERKVFAHLPLSDGPTVNDSLTQVGFRRSQNIAYRPACETCRACQSARAPAGDYVFSRSERKVLNRNDDLERHLVEAEATLEQFELLRRYLLTRHADGGMAEMTWPDYVAMVEDTAVRTHLIEYRSRSQDRGPGDLIACVLVDVLADGLSLVYSFYDPGTDQAQPGLVHHPGSPGPGPADRPALRLSGLLGARQREDGLQGALLAAGDPQARRLGPDVGPRTRRPPAQARLGANRGSRPGMSDAEPAELEEL